MELNTRDNGAGIKNKEDLQDKSPDPKKPAKEERKAKGEEEKRRGKQRQEARKVK